MSTPAVSPIPANMPTLTPHIVCRGADAAIDFYVRAFGAVELARMPGPDGRLMHAMVRIGDSPLMLVDEFPEMDCHSPQSLKGTPVILHLYVADVDAAIARAAEAGARVTLPPADMFWGDRYGRIEDPFGHAWSLASHLRDMSAEEIVAASAQGCTGAA
ncbi:VOC family protein [Zoogloea sp.]|uniref:VOC family protein n=1 Tax=Zoogloea sp. TaxID=49181 RepID=UPI001D581FBD|nr:VOC family protein [Zoogloea sp.]MBK6656000.1 VOC family protein [Zoogloea sp.]MBK7847828.1 VOC family protein [Zoogloea sp.]